MSSIIIYVDTSEIRQGKLAQLKTAMKHLTSFVEENMPRLISYNFFLNKNENKMTVVSIHPDSVSLEYHLNRGKDEFRKFAELINLLKIEVYGNVSESVIEKLQQKSQMLGSGKVSLQKFYTGFTRKI